MEFKNFSQLLIFFSVRFQTFQFLRRGFKNCAAGAKQRRERRGGEGRAGRGRNGWKGKGVQVPFPLSLIPSPFSCLLLPFLRLRRRFEEVAWHDRRAATFNAWSISNDKAKETDQGSPCQRGHRGFRNESCAWRLLKAESRWRSIQRTSQSQLRCFYQQ